jgi:hypothetical protein
MTRVRDQFQYHPTMDICIYLFLGIMLFQRFSSLLYSCKILQKLWERNVLNNWKVFDITPFLIIFDAFSIRSTLCFNSYAIFIFVSIYLTPVVRFYLVQSCETWCVKLCLSCYKLPELPVTNSWNVKLTPGKSVLRVRQTCDGRRYWIHGWHKLINFICILLNVKNSLQVANDELVNSRQPHTGKEVRIAKSV